MSNDAFIEVLLNQLGRYKGFPKYQYERRIDAFICFFLPDVLSCHLGMSTSPHRMWCEFPVATHKKDATPRRLSSNIDYACYFEQNNSIAFVELKTNASSIEKTQVNYYNSAVAMLWNDHIKDIEWLSEKSDEKDKYEYLLGEIRQIKPTHAFPVMLAPTNAKQKLCDMTRTAPVKWQFISLNEYANTKITTEHKDVWRILSKHLLDIDSNGCP